MVGVGDERLHKFVRCHYASEKHVNNPPTVEALRFVVLEYLRVCRKSNCEEPTTTRDQDTQSLPWLYSAPHPQHTTEPVVEPTQQTFLVPPEPQLPQEPAPCACRNCDNGNQLSPNCSPSYEVQNMVHAIASCDPNARSENQIKERAKTTDRSVQADFSTTAKSSQTEPPPAPIMCDKVTDQSHAIDKAETSSDNYVRILSLSNSDGPPAPVMITCGEKQLCTALEPPEHNCQETMVSIHLLLSVEQQTRPNLTLHQLK